MPVRKVLLENIADQLDVAGGRPDPQVDHVLVLDGGGVEVAAHEHRGLAVPIAGIAGVVHRHGLDQCFCTPLGDFRILAPVEDRPPHRIGDRGQPLRVEDLDVPDFPALRPRGAQQIAAGRGSDDRADGVGDTFPADTPRLTRTSRSGAGKPVAVLEEYALPFVVVQLRDSGGLDSGIDAAHRDVFE